MKKLNKKGFTLVELLAVIVILALLMVVATSTIGNTLTSSKFKALGTEAQKLYRKTVEDLTAINMGLGSTYTYGTESSGLLTLKDNNYTMYFTVSGNAGEKKLTTFCIDDGTQRLLGKIENGAIVWNTGYDTAYKTGKCTNATTPA